MATETAKLREELSTFVSEKLFWCIMGLHLQLEMQQISSNSQKEAGGKQNAALLYKNPHKQTMTACHLKVCSIHPHYPNQCMAVV